MKITNPYESDQSILLSLIPPKILNDLKQIRQAFESEGETVRLVGGSVRDMLLGKSPKDYDMATTATPEQMLEISKKHQLKTIANGTKHGVITFNVNDENYEITTLRTQSNFTGRHADLKWTDDWTKDAECRDLTINAMSLGLDGKLYDYFNGQQHLKSGAIQFVGDATLRIEEDHLRILRYFRFLGKISDPKLDRKTLDVINQNLDGLEKISGERIWSEVKQILLSPNAVNALRIMCKTELPLFLEIKCEKINRFAQLRKYTNNPATLYAILTLGVGNINDFNASNEEKALINFIDTRRQQRITLRDLKLGMALGKISPELAIESSIALGLTQDAQNLRNWEIPKIPVSGADLLASGMKPGKQVGAMLKNIYKTWANYNFNLTKDQLLEKHSFDISTTK